jgi:uncharacterized protein YllA (UPF0747 family)
MAASADYGGYGSAFRDVLRGVFEEYALRIVTPMEIRRYTGPVLARLVEKWPEVCRGLKEGARQVEDAGLKPPLASAGLFEMVDGCRRAVDIAEGRAVLSSGTVSLPEAAQEIMRRPEDFSGGAALGPVLQDAVLPVAVTLAGPSEIVYLRQIRPLYETAGVAPSIALPRISATFVEKGIARAARKAGLAREQIFDAAGLLESLSSEPAADPEIAEVRRAGGVLMKAVNRAAGPTPGKAVDRAERSVRAGIRKLVGRLSEEKRASRGVGRKRLERVKNAVMPGGRPQERTVNVMEYLSVYGPEFVRCAVERLDARPSGHQVVFLSVEP